VVTVLLAACATIVDYQVPLRMNAYVRMPNGEPAPDTEVVIANGLTEQTLGVTDASGHFAGIHAFLWGHREGAKASPAQFKLILRHGNCTPASQTRMINAPRDPDGFYPVDVRETLECESTTNPQAKEPR
jgi:hypothetical protein